MILKWLVDRLCESFECNIVLSDLLRLVQALRWLAPSGGLPLGLFRRLPLLSSRCLGRLFHGSL